MSNEFKPEHLSKEAIPLTMDYFMKYMTQTEFEIITKGSNQIPYRFNLIRKVINEN